MYWSVRPGGRVASAHSPKTYKCMNTPESLRMFVCGWRRESGKNGEDGDQ